MWTRSLLKQNAKEALRGRYWRSFLLCILLSLIGVGYFTPEVSSAFDTMESSIKIIVDGPVWYGDSSSYLYDESLYSQLTDLLINDPLMSTLVMFGVGAMLISSLINLCLSLFVRVPLRIGSLRYFMESRQAPAPLGTVMTAFRTPYLNLVKVQFLVGLKIALGCLIIVPGIYWSYCYRQVPYLIAENPYLTTSRAMELSRAMMDGEKWRSFVLDLSFLGWSLLCVLTFGIGYFFLEPYYQATMAEFYAALRSKAFQLNLTDDRELGGFVRHETAV